MSKESLRNIQIVWWRFFWRYAIVFVVVNFLFGFVLNSLGQSISSYIYLIAIFYGVWANLIATLVAMFYCLGRRFKKSALVLCVRRNPSGISYKLWVWFRYFVRFIIFAFAIGFALGAGLPLLFKLFGHDPMVALKYSKYMGYIAILPASYMAFRTLARRRIEKSTLVVTVCD